MNTSRKRKLLILGSHPIPYRSPLYRELAKREDLEILVLYGDDYGMRPRKSAWGMKEFVWKTNLTEGYPHIFLRNWSPKPDPSTLSGKLNPGLIPVVYKFKPHAVLASGYIGLYSLQGLASALALRKPILFLGENNSAAGNPRGLRGKIKPFILRRLYSHFSAFLVIGERNRQHYRNLGVPDYKMYDFPYAVDNEHFIREAERLKGQRAKLRAGWSIPADAICAVYSGRLVSVKNVGELIKGVERVSGLHLLIVGDGPERKYLEALASERIPSRHTFVGFLNQDRLGEAYTAADIFALTSSYEPWGLVCNEAMNFGLPLVLSDRVGASADLVVSGETGWSYPLGDLDALARALEKTKEMVSSGRSEMSETVRRRVANFNYKSQADGVTEALHWVLARKREPLL